MSDTINFRFIGTTSDELLIFEDRDYPSDAPQTYVRDADIRGRHSTDPLFRERGKFFAVTERHAKVRGIIRSAGLRISVRTVRVTVDDFQREANE